MDFLSVDDLSSESLFAIFRRAAQLKSAYRERRMPQSLPGLRVGLINNDTGWRNTTAFDLGAQSMGACVVHVPVDLEGSEILEDLAGYLDNWFDLVVARAPSLDGLRKLASATEVPVINARTRTNHPCEVLGDLSFVLQERGALEDLTVAVVAPQGNILSSWIEAAAVLPIRVVQVFSAEWLVACSSTSARFSASSDPRDALSADVTITDCWPAGADLLHLAPYRVTGERLAMMRPDALFIPCPPVNRGKEVSAEAMASDRCRATAAKAFLMYAQCALLEHVLSRS